MKQNSFSCPLLFFFFLTLAFLPFPLTRFLPFPLTRFVIKIRFQRFEKYLNKPID